MAALIIEDEPKTANAIRGGLEADGYEVVIASRGEQGMALLEIDTFEVIVLDWMLPGCSGIEILQWLRGRGDRTPVLLLTARDAVEDRVLGLDSGADDYLVKPFAIEELLARLRVLLRHSAERDAPHVVQVGDLSIDGQSRLVRRGGRRIALSPREFDLLNYLARHAGHTVSRKMLARDVWHELQRATPLDNVIDVHIAHLRRKIDDDSPAKLLRTVRGIGFMLQDPSTDE